MERAGDPIVMQDIFREYLGDHDTTGMAPKILKWLASLESQSASQARLCISSSVDETGQLSRVASPFPVNSVRDFSIIIMAEFFSNKARAAAAAEKGKATSSKATQAQDNMRLQPWVEK